MIRYELDERLDRATASQCRHPALARLQSFGPWSACESPTGVALVPAWAKPVRAWGHRQAGLGGLFFRLADPLPACDLAHLARPGTGGTPVALTCGLTIAIAPAIADGITIGLDGGLGAPATAYGRLADQIATRLATDGDVSCSPPDPQLLDLARLALASCHRLTPELIAAWGLLSTADLAPIYDAAVGLPKADAGGGG
jgi:hypothetical protein